jgi:hypothetical protein
MTARAAASAFAARAVVCVSACVAACARAPGEATRASSSTGASPKALSSAFSREAFATPRGAAGDAGPAEPAVPASADPAALDEILAAASAKASAAAAPADPSDLLGTDTGVALDGGADRAASTVRGAKVSVGKVTIEPGVSSPGVERAARAQLYWPLVQRCRDEAGAILPPEVVRIRLSLDADGYIVPASIHASAKDPRFAEAARCMERELAAATFRAPPAGRGSQQGVEMDVPSVD